MISLIAAVDTNYAIGKNGTMPWSIPEDLAFFQRETRGGACIMGRRTWESLPGELKGRLNIIVTRNPIEGKLCASSVDQALALAKKSGYMRFYGIGGNGIYEALMPIADRLVLTHLSLTVDDPDTYFPKPDKSWMVTTSIPLSTRAVAREYKRI